MRITPAGEMETSTRLDSLVPVAYRKRILATALACRIIYNEGVHFLDATLGMNVQQQNATGSVGVALAQSSTIPHALTAADYNTKIAEWSFRYLMEHERTSQLIDAVCAATKELDSETRERLVRVLERGGTRIGVELANE